MEHTSDETQSRPRAHRWCAGFVAVSLLLGCSDESKHGTEPEDAGPALCTSCGACEQVVAISGSSHVAGDIVYPDPPPAGGDHNACWADWGTHTMELGDEYWVHNLEHGGVVFLHHCPAGCADEIAAMAAFVDAHANEQALLTPYSLLPAKFAVVAWGVRLVTDCFDEALFEAFYAKHVNHGPEALSAYPPDGCHSE